MKRLGYAIIGIAALLASCGEVDENERFIYVKPADVNRCVLIEDFTGQRCPNCPNATAEIHKIQEVYGDHVIAVAIHCGPQSLPAPYGLATETGKLYGTSTNIEAYPTGRVNRIGTPSTPDNWQSLVSQRINEVASVSLNVEASYDEATKTAVANVTAIGTNGNTNGKLQLWVVEDHITAYQDMPDGTHDLNYEHNHVFRSAVNGEWGEDFSINEGEDKDVSHSFAVEDGWNAENLSVVAFVYNENGVQQVAKTALKAVSEIEN